MDLKSFVNAFLSSISQPFLSLTLLWRNKHRANKIALEINIQTIQYGFKQQNGKSIKLVKTEKQYSQLSRLE